MDASFKRFILKEMHFEVADISLSLHVLSEGFDVPSGSKLPLRRCNCFNKDLLRDYWGCTEIWGPLLFRLYQVFIRMINR